MEEEEEEEYFLNTFPSYSAKDEFKVDIENVKELIKSYVDVIIEATYPKDSEGESDSDENNTRGDIYSGNAGIAFMFWKMSRSHYLLDMYPALDHAAAYIKNAKENLYQYKKKSDERCAFLLGNAGIFAISALISFEVGDTEMYFEDIKHFHEGFIACKPINFTSFGSDDLSVGRAGYLCACYWLNDVLPAKPIAVKNMLEVCNATFQSGVQYAEATAAPLPAMYQYHGVEYLGHFHGLSGVLHMLLESPWFRRKAKVSRRILQTIRASVDYLLTLQDKDGSFPISLDDVRSEDEKRLLHWCHGAPGVAYLFAKAFLLFKKKTYLNAVIGIGELIWKKGLLKKGPGICHGVAGNAYVFLLLFRLTKSERHLYRANKFMEFLKSGDFRQQSKVPDRPFSLYEGIAGTVCFLTDLLEPEKASFPFMNVFRKV